MRTALRWLGGLVGLAALAALMLGVGVWLGSQNAEPQTAGGRATPSASPLAVAALPSPAEVDYLIATPEPSGIVVGPTIRPGIPSAMPITGDCLACHSSSDGGVGTKEIPALAHPLKGWSQCTSCHDSSRLVKTAPGHSGIHAEGCTLCHTRQSVATPMRPHTLDLTAGCLTCHGKDESLPHSMKDRSATNCWLCHQSSPDQAPTTPHHVDTQIQCRSCHEPARLGGLPRTHDGWADRTCITCHKQSKRTIPIAPHELSERVGLCSFCHEGASFAPESGLDEEPGGRAPTRRASRARPTRTPAPWMTTMGHPPPEPAAGPGHRTGPGPGPGRRARARRVLWCGSTGRTALPGDALAPAPYGWSTHDPHDEPAVRTNNHERVDADRIGVLLAIGDFPLLVTGLRTVIDAEPDMCVVGTVDTLEAVRERLDETGAEVVIAECQPGGRSGCATYAGIEALKAARPGTRVLVMECRCGSEQFSIALKAGADGFLTREAVDADVVAAVRCVQRGQTYVSPAIVTRMVNTYVLRSPSEALTDPYESLSDRDKEVLLLAATGYTNREIARTLHLSEQTVHNYRATIMEKLALHDRVELLKFAVRRGLIEVADL